MDLEASLPFTLLPLPGKRPHKPGQNTVKVHLERSVLDLLALQVDLNHGSTGVIVPPCALSCAAWQTRFPLKQEFNAFINCK